MADVKEYLSVTQTARAQGVTRQAILQVIARGTLKATRVGNQYLIRKVDLERFSPHPGGRPSKPGKRRKGADGGRPKEARVRLVRRKT